MRLPVISMIIWIIFNLGTSIWIFNILRKRYIHNKAISYAWLALVIVITAITVVAVSTPYRSGDDTALLKLSWMLFIIMTFTVPQIIYLIFDLIGRIPVLTGKNRCKWLSRIGISAAYILFIAMWWGALFNRFNINVNEIDAEIENLPSSFDGYRIVQFSDLHIGSFGQNTDFVAKLVESINEQNADAVFFTGDIVNRRSRELKPFMSTLEKIHAVDGVVAILGNHDYGDYFKWYDSNAKLTNMEELTDSYRDIGWRLLRNHTIWFTRGNDSIAILGVENIGDKPFPIYGSLHRTYRNINDNKTKILLSHNPSHWVDSISNHDDINIALTLSGHTHAMQVEVAGLSPAALRYKKWSGLYKDNSGKHLLYVNIGAGTVGFPMRLGATPEITVITLRQKKAQQ